ncbi:hypothetical protein DFQ28_009108, partial [Apophysomyces sp. BC1034]
MEAHVRAERFPSLLKFCTAHADPVKVYIRNFESVEAAKKNLQTKMKLAFSNARGKKKRGPGMDIDLEPLFAEAKAATVITVAGWKVLAASVQRLENAYVSEQNIVNGKSNDNDTENASSSEEQADSASDDHRYDEEDGYNLPRRLREYKRAAKVSSEKHGFYVDGHLQEILSLSNVLFLKENEYSEQQISHFGLANLDRLRNAMVDEYMDSSVRFDTNLYNQISAALRDFRPQDGTRVMKERVNDLARNADDNDYSLIDIFVIFLVRVI